MLVVVAALALPGRARAAGDPSLTWWTYETAHFRVHHPHTLDPVARRVAHLCETIRERLIEEMGYAPEHATEILLTDDVDTANGSASPVPYDTIRLFVSAPPDISALGDYDDWQLELITHEYTHILHTGNISGAATIFNAVFGRTLSPNSANPRWLIEGLAVVQETEHTSGGRGRATLFDTFMRADVLDDRVARLDQISGATFRYPQGNLWYLYGAKFLRWISDVYGPDTMPAVAADYSASVIPFGYSRAIRRVTGRTYDQLYDAWIEDVKNHAFEQVRDVEKRGLREGTRISARGGSAAYPVFVPKHARLRPDVPEILYSRGDQDQRAGLYRFDLGSPTDPSPRDEKLVARTAADAYASFEPDGDVVFNQTEIWKTVYSRTDLYRLPKGKTSPYGTETTRERLTVGWRASEPDISRDGRKIVYTLNNAGTTTVSISDLDAQGHIGPSRTLLRGAPYDQAYTPRFSPDGRYVAYSSWTAGGYRDLRVIEVATGKFWEITKDRAMDMGPAWSSDGRHLYFSSDRSGIFNIYMYDLASRAIVQVTNVRVAALMPAVDEDEKTLAYVGFGTRGYDLFTMRLDPARHLEAPPPPTDRPPPPPAPRPVKIHHEAYNPLPTFGPRSYFFSVGQGNYSPTAVTIEASASDIVGLHSASLAFRAEPDAPSPTATVSYSYNRLPVDLGVSFTKTVRPRGGWVIDDREILYDEDSTSVTASASLPLPHAFVSQSIGLSYSAQYDTADLPIPRDTSPYATTSVRPPEGYLGTFRLGYAVSTAEGSLTAPGAYRGSTLRISATYGGEETLSDESLYGFEIDGATYVPMPWPGFHVLAIRGAGGIVAGTYARRGFYYVGGYDLQRASALDALTGTFDGSFVLRGYLPSAYAGTGYALSTFEYRAPLVQPDVGLSTLPIFLKRIDGAAFIDWGGAFDQFRADQVRLFYGGDLVWSPDLHASIGGELWFQLTLAHRADTLFKLGYAYGFSPEAVPGGQIYFMLNSSF
jgi:hypothetical protein